MVVIHSSIRWESLLGVLGDWQEGVLQGQLGLPNVSYDGKYGTCWFQNAGVE